MKPRTLSVVAFTVPVFKSYVLTNIGNNFYTFCPFPLKEVFMEE